MKSLRSSCSLFGMVRHHVTALAAIFVCNLLMTSAQSAPNAGPLNLLTSKAAQAPHKQPTADVTQPDTAPDLQQPSASAGSHQTTEAEMQNEAVPAQHAPSAVRVGAWKRMHGDDLSADVLSQKRFIQGFVGSRGKKSMGSQAVPARPARSVPSLDAWKRSYDGPISADAFPKRFNQWFVGSRGKKSGGEEEEEEAKLLFPAVLGAQTGEGDSQQDAHAVQRRYFNPAGFTASRGKRYMPGLEALLLSQMYKKLDAEKWKRQPMLGFHAARG